MALIGRVKGARGGGVTRLGDAKRVRRRGVGSRSGPPDLASTHTFALGIRCVPAMRPPWMGCFAPSGPSPP